MNNTEFLKIIKAHDFAHMHKDFKKDLLDRIRNQDYALVKNVATQEARMLYELNRQVCGSIHRLQGFTRFKISKHGVLYTVLELEHDIAEPLLRFFHERFPMFYIAIEDDNKTYVIDTQGNITSYGFDVAQTLKILESKLPVNALIENISFDDQESEQLWEKYYDSQYIGERRNLKLRNKHIPKKYQDAGSTESRLAKRCHELSEFIIE